MKDNRYSEIDKVILFLLVLIELKIVQMLEELLISQWLTFFFLINLNFLLVYKNLNLNLNLDEVFTYLAESSACCVNCTEYDQETWCFGGFGGETVEQVAVGPKTMWGKVQL